MIKIILSLTALVLVQQEVWSQPLNDVACSEEGLKILHENDRSKFYHCENVQLILKNCPPWTEFFSFLGDCSPYESTSVPPEDLSNTTPEDPSNTTPEDTSNTNPEDPPITTPEDPSNTTPEDPSNTTPEDPSNTTPITTPEDPSNTTPEDPSNTSPEDPSNTTPEDPSNTTPITTPEDPSNTTPEDPSNTTPEDPSNTTPEDPSNTTPITTPEDPSNTTPEDPSNTTSEDPSNTTPEDPSNTTPITTPEDPSNTTPEDPSNTTPADPTNTTPEDPSNTTPEDPSPPTGAIISTTASPNASVEDSCEYLDNGCPADFDIHLLLPHETSCRKFYFCVRGERVLRTCASGLVFNPDIENCVHAGSIDRTCEDEDSSEEDESISEEYVEPEEIELLPNGCPVNYTISMYLPHEYYCNAYYQCVFGEKVNQLCPGGTHYNQEVQNCDHIANVNCQLPGGNFIETTTTTEVPTTPSIAFQPNGCPVDQSVHWLVAHENCTKFYFCVWGGLVESDCPDGLYFNPVAQYCDNPALAGCVNDPCKKKPCSNTESSTSSTTESASSQTTDSISSTLTDSTTTSTIIDITDPTSEIPAETTISNNSNPNTNSTTEATAPTTTVDHSDLTTNIPSEATVPTTTTDFSEVTTIISTEATAPTTTTDSLEVTTYISTEATGPTTTVDTSEITTNIPTEATASTTITNNSYPTPETSTDTSVSTPTGTTDIPIEATVSTTVVDETVSTSIPSTTSSSTVAPNITTTISPTTEDSCEYLDNGCPVDFDMHFLLPHETSCRKFYYCVHGEKVLSKCATGLVFNPDIGNCAHAGSIDRTCEDEESSSEEYISEEIVEPEEIELLPNGCPVNYTYSMYLPHEYYCNVYYQCIYGQTVERYCPDKTYFNYVTQTCDHINNVNCTSGAVLETTTTTQAPTESTTKPDLLPNGCPVNGSISWLVAHEECTKYYACVWGGLIEMDCPGGTHFNAVEQFCDNPATAGCKICKKPCCSENNGENSCDGNTDNENDEEEDINNEQSNEENDSETDDNDENNGGDYDDNNEENNSETDDNDAELSEENNDNPNSNENAETDCNAAENEIECLEDKKCEEDCNTLPRAHRDCDKYWVCYGKKAVLITCAEGLHFNPSTSTCDFACFAGCVRENVQATASNEGLKLFLPWDKIDEDMKSVLKRLRY